MHFPRTIFLLDGYHFIFRAYFVNPPLTTPGGTPIGAVYGFASMIMRIINELKPQYIAVVFDSGAKNFRHDIYPEYKSHRPLIPDDLKVQFPLAREVTKYFNLNTIEVPKVEADDVIASLVSKFSNGLDKFVVVSSDKDLLQLVNDNVCVYDPVKGEYLQEQEVIKKMGVKPSQVRDLLALIGDKSDYIPGVPGIGPKIAIDLINQFGTLDQILKNYNDIKQDRRRNLIKDNKNLVELSWQLVGLKKDLNIDLIIEDLIWIPPNAKQIQELIQKFGFKSLAVRASKIFNIKLEDKIVKWSKYDSKNISKIELSSMQLLQQMQMEAMGNGYISILLNKNLEGNLYIEFSTVFNKLYFIKLEKLQLEVSDSLDDDRWWCESIIKILTDNSIQKITYNLKELFKFFSKLLPDLEKYNCFDDIMLMNYILSAGRNSISLAETIKIYDKDYVDQDLENNPCLLKAIFDVLKLQLFKEKFLHLYYEIDLPLCYVLYDIENTGIKIDRVVLHDLSKFLGQKVKTLEQQIYQLCGMEFNINSPKQLGEVLFDVLKLPHSRVSKKTHTYSTDSEVLEGLSNSGIELADLLLKWRQLTKLITTYTDALPPQVNPQTQRIHTTFLQTSTTTGRLSSQSPNLQNIPIRSEYGYKIRSAFCAEQGYKILSVDYSQIELRILSYLANIKSLKKCFCKRRRCTCYYC